MRRVKVKIDNCTTEGWIHGFNTDHGELVAIFEDGDGSIQLVYPFPGTIQFLEPPTCQECPTCSHKKVVEPLKVTEFQKLFKCPTGMPGCPTGDSDESELSCSECRKQYAK